MDSVTFHLEEAVAFAAALLPFTSPEHPRIAFSGVLLGQWPTGRLVAAATDGESAAVYEPSSPVAIEGPFQHPEPGVWLPRPAVRWLASYKLPTRPRRKKTDAELELYTLWVGAQPGSTALQVFRSDSVEPVAQAIFPADLRGTTFPSLIELAQVFHVQTRPVAAQVDPVKLEAVGRWARQHRRTLNGRTPNHAGVHILPRVGTGVVLQVAELSVALPSRSSEEPIR